MSQNEEQIQDTNNDHSLAADTEMHEVAEVTSLESSLPPDLYIAKLQCEESTSSLKRRSVLFSERYSHSGSFEDSPSLPDSPPPGPLISPWMSVPTDASSPRYSWVFSLDDSEGINVSNLSNNPPEWPLSSPPGKPLSPRASSNFVSTDPLNLIPGSSMPLSTLLTQLPLAEIVVHESDEPAEDTVNESEKRETKDEKHVADDAKYQPESVAKIDSLPLESNVGLSEDVMSQTISEDHLPRLDINVNRDSDEQQLTTYSSPMTENSAFNVHSAIANFMKSSTLTGSSGYHSDSVIQGPDFQSSKRRESSSTAPTEISNTSDETHVISHGKFYKSNSANSLVCVLICTCMHKIMYFTQNTLTTESEEDTSTNIISVADLHLSKNKTVSDSTVSSTTENKHVVKAGFVILYTYLLLCFFVYVHVCLCVYALRMGNYLVLLENGMFVSNALKFNQNSISYLQRHSNRSVLVLRHLLAGHTRC